MESPSSIETDEEDNQSSRLINHGSEPPLDKTNDLTIADVVHAINSFLAVGKPVLVTMVRVYVCCIYIPLLNASVSYTADCFSCRDLYH